MIRGKWVRVMCDYEAQGLWGKGGGAELVDDLPVPVDLRRRIHAWQESYEAHDPLERQSRDEPIDWTFLRAFSEEGLSIAQAIKAELPDWTVVYFDAARVDASQPRSVYEYEV